MKHPVYLVDDDEAVRRALKLLLSTISVEVNTFSDPQSFLSQLDRLSPGCLVLDIRMPLISGLKLQEKLIEQQIDWPVVIISGHGDIEACRRAFHLGAVDFLSKPIDEMDLIDAIQKGNEVLESHLQSQAAKIEIKQQLSLMTTRENEVLNLIAKGYTTRQIAQGLGLSPRTVESHRAAIAAKLGTTSQSEMTRIWITAYETP